jgi:hypothetical protein
LLVRSALPNVPLLVCSAGVFLGLFFNVLVLLPVSLTGSAIFILLNPSSGLSFYANLGGLLFLLMGQSGYMQGLTCRDTYGHILARLQAAQSNRI